MAEINCVMWNCSGILPTSSADEKLEFLKTCTNSKFDILILIETHHKQLDDISSHFHIYKNNYYLLHTEATDGDPYAGIVVLINNRYTLTQCSVLLPGRLLNFKVKNKKEEYNVSALYGYTGKNASAEKIKLFTEILNGHHDKSDNNIILGDFNFVDNDLDRTNQTRLGMNQVDKTLSKLWVKYTDKIDLSDSFRAKNPKKRMFSYIHTKDRSKSRLDRVYVNDENCNNVIFYKHIPTPFIKAHRIVSFTIKEQNERGSGYWKMNTSVISDRPYSIMVENTVSDVLALNIDDPIERWLVFVETVRIETRVYCSKKRFQERKIKTLCEQNIEILEQNPLLSQNQQLHEEYEYNLCRINDWHRKVIDGYQTRIKTQPKFEYGEPNIAFFADLEKKASKKKTITQLMDSEGEIKHDTEDLKQIATDFYTDLFDTKVIDDKKADKLLKNVKKKITLTERTALDKLITKEELEFAIRKLQKNKTPGPDGIPAEFYQVFWYLIQDLYFDFINEVRITAFPKEKNVTITTLIYKDKGEIYLLANFRPISLMNVDIKILTKLLSMRLKFVLPSIIHETQTAVYGRRIGDTIHLIRDIIDLANQNDEEAALLFLDQEKAFDRVNHKFLFKALEKYGFGNSFIHWIKLLYSNASTKLNINGFLSDNIPVKSGVRQGCPLSALLYVLVIEILALQLRANPNIVGFTIHGEKIISSHYHDDAVIKITQNRCFKEVYKDLQEYEKATGAKINYDKTKGLWIGKWKNRKDDPLLGLYPENSKHIKWTNKNVKYLGIYVGNDEPSLQTFKEIVPKMKRRLHFWKPLKLPILAKSRVIEIYHASKLFYAANFYPIPLNMENEINDAFIDYIKFPKKTNEVSKMEMEKLRICGGIKLINIKLKSETPKIHWLINLISNDNLKIHRKIFNSLIGIQRGHLQGEDIIFADISYSKCIKINNPFYLEAFKGIWRLNTWKHISDIKNEHLFYNPIFTTTTEYDIHDKTLRPFQGNRLLAKIKTYGDLLAAENTIIQPRLKAVIRRKKDSIEHIRDNVQCNLIIGTNGSEHAFNTITQNFIYSELIHEQSLDHIYQTKWILERNELGVIDWDQIWGSIHNQFFTEEVKTTIWQLIHLNFYTTYNYNKWHNVLQPCPLCNKIPEDIFHIILDCKFTKTMWKRIEKTLLKIIPKPPTAYEKAFGIQPANKKEIKPTILRNWITFSLRHYIMLEERMAYHINNYTSVSVQKFFLKYNHNAQQELNTKKMQYDFQGLSSKFEKIVTINNAIASIFDGELILKDIM